MKTSLYILLLTGWCVVTTHAQQPLTKSYIDEWVQRAFPEARLDSQTVYIFNGYLLIGQALDSALALYTIQKIKKIDYLHDEVIAKTVFCSPPRNVVLIATYPAVASKKRMWRRRK